MMRTLLGIVAMMCMWMCNAPVSAQPKERALPKGCPREVTGDAVDQDKAKEKALDEAVKIVAGLMKAHEPPLQSLKVDEKYVRMHVVDEGRAGKDLDNPALEKPFKSWILTFRTDHDWWQELQRRDRAEERQKLATLICLGLATLLLAGFGYVRLDEYTQRRYTTWLRLAGVGVLSTVAAAWWFIFFQAPG